MWGPYLIMISPFLVSFSALMADRDILVRRDLNGTVFIHDSAGQVLAGFNLLNYHHSHGIFRDMYHEMNHANFG